MANAEPFDETALARLFMEIYTDLIAIRGDEYVHDLMTLGG
jgi:hypothetical protein